MNGRAGRGTGDAKIGGGSGAVDVSDDQVSPAGGVVGQSNRVGGGIDGGFELRPAGRVDGAEKIADGLRAAERDEGIAAVGGGDLKIRGAAGGGADAAMI